MVVASPDDLVAAVSRDRRMAGYRVRRQGDGWIELEVVALDAVVVHHAGCQVGPGDIGVKETRSTVGAFGELDPVGGGRDRAAPLDDVAAVARELGLDARDGVIDAVRHADRLAVGLAGPAARALLDVFGES